MEESEQWLPGGAEAGKPGEGMHRGDLRLRGGAGSLRGRPADGEQLVTKVWISAAPAGVRRIKSLTNSSVRFQRDFWKTYESKYLTALTLTDTLSVRVQ